MDIKHKILVTFVLIVQVFCSYSYAQTPTTEGKEFWLSFMKNEKTPELSINVSAKRACVMTIKNPNSGYTSTVNLVAGLNKIQPTLTPTTECYVTSSEVVEKKALYITSTDTISLFASNYVSKVFDVSGILPTNALLDEYMIQTYPNSSQKPDYSPEFLIVATENNTIVDITPTMETAGGKVANQSFSVTLNKGECYQVQTKNKVEGSDLSGSLVKARNGKKIAVFNGNERVNIPYDGSNEGDHLFEQAMPVSFWGTQFVISRSLDRAVDFIRVTARNNDTSIKRNGVVVATINSGQTYQFELLTPDESCFIETSCPAAVYLYLVSKHEYNGGESIGGPSMIWISPIEQMIKEINFCTYTTENTTNHYINLVTLTGNTGNVSLAGKTAGNVALKFKPVTGNASYSYAMTTLLDDSYTLKSKTGVIAHVYGLGDSESYGYSAGSSAKIQKGVSVNNKPFISSFPDSISCCLGDSLTFVAEMKNIQSVNWNLGNGVQRTDSTFKYVYPTAGNYNLVTTIKSFNNTCDNTGLFTTINIKIKIKNATPKHHYQTICMPGNPQNTLHTTIKTDTVSYQCDSVVYFHNTINYETYNVDSKTAFDSLTWIDGKKYYESTTTPSIKLKNKAGCDSIISLKLNILKCLEIKVEDSQLNRICSNSSQFSIPYVLSKGKFNRFSAEFDDNAKAAGFSQASVTDNGSEFIVSVPAVPVPNNYVLNLTLFDDNICGRREKFILPFTINYSGIISQKWNDVLAISSKTGYEFTGFQWYKNGNIIEGATGPNYYVGSDGSTLDFNAEYSVELTRNDGVKVMSCGMIPTLRLTSSIISVYPTVTDKGQTIHILNTENCTATLVYPIGVKQTKFKLKSGSNSINSPLSSGVYLLNVVFDNGDQQSFRIIVK